MKRFSKVVAGMALVAMPALASAQVDVTMQITGQTIPAGIGGGGGQFTATTNNSNLSNLLVYCIDRDRSFAYSPATYNYRVFTFAQYLSAVLPAAFEHQSIDDLKQIAMNTNTISMGAGGAADNAQENTWDIFDNTTNVALGSLANFNSDKYLILVSIDAIDGRVGSQTFMTTVPEPSTYAMLATGLFVIGVATRRRRA